MYLQIFFIQFMKMLMLLDTLKRVLSVFDGCMLGVSCWTEGLASYYSVSSMMFLSVRKST